MCGFKYRPPRVHTSQARFIMSNSLTALLCFRQTHWRGPPPPLLYHTSKLVVLLFLQLRLHLTACLLLLPSNQTPLLLPLPRHLAPLLLPLLSSPKLHLPLSSNLAPLPLPQSQLITLEGHRSLVVVRKLSPEKRKQFIPPSPRCARCPRPHVRSRPAERPMTQTGPT